MELKDGRITILINPEKTTIELIDDQASTVFASIELTPNQLSRALGRGSYTECKIVLNGLDRLGKKMENKTHEFQIPSVIPYEQREKVLSEVIKETLPDGWVSDNYFNSQNTYFKKDGKDYARTTIRRWI